jgi:hypothetical protein
VDEGRGRRRGDEGGRDDAGAEMREDRGVETKGKGRGDLRGERIDKGGRRSREEGRRCKGVRGFFPFALCACVCVWLRTGVRALLVIGTYLFASSASCASADCSNPYWQVHMGQDRTGEERRRERR